MVDSTALMTQLEDEYRTTLELIETHDLETVVHTDSGWRIKDVIIHVSFHDILRWQMLNAHFKGVPNEVPLAWQLNNLPEDLHKRNQLIYEERHNYSNERVLNEYKKYREQINALYQNLTEDELQQEIKTDFGRVSLEKALEWTIGHDKHHRAEILAALDIS